tara:strand:+ start:1068 stop:2000 length:933 start_codon:yes stop_codon:yes gene_type:complete
MHKPPEKLKRGWRRHVEAHNALIDYAYRTHPIPAHGHKETVNGTMPPAPPQERLMQFTPILHPKQGDTDPSLTITPGYVFAASGAGTHLPVSQEWVHEPQIDVNGVDKDLTADPPPALTLTKEAHNYIYLKVTWSANEHEIGGHVFETVGGTTEYAFPIAYNLQVLNLPDETGSATVDGTAHTHAIDTSSVGAVADGVSASGRPPGAFVKVDRTFYTLSSATFEVQTSTTGNPPQESELIQYLLAGHIYLDANGEVAKDGSDDGLRWFLNGAIWLEKPPVLISGYTAPDAAEPTPPSDPAASTLKPPGIA